MKYKSPLLVGALLASLFSAVNPAIAQGTLFTYQGRLNNSGSPVNGLYDLRFKLYEDSLGNTQVGATFATNAIPTTNGLFTTGIDFGAGIFTGSNYWLEVDVKTNGAGSYTVLSPLQPITPTPYAIFASTASNLSGTLPATQLSGSVPSANLSGTYGSTVTFNNANGNFTGNGGGLTGVNAASLNGLNSSNFWHTGGNNNTPPGANYLGTADNQPLEVRVNNTRVLRLEPDTRGLSAGNVIGGHTANAITQPGSGGDVIAGGGSNSAPNLVLANTIGVFIGAGSANSVGPNVGDSAIPGGYGNTIQSSDAAIGGGQFNTIQLNSPLSVIGGGLSNLVQSGANNAVIGGGTMNTIQYNADHAVISGGQLNTIPFGISGAVISGGEWNTNGGAYSFIAGGQENSIQPGADISAIGGGELNTIQTNAFNGTIGGGLNNTIQTGAAYALIGGGFDNTVQGSGSFSTIGGGFGNLASGLGAVIGGGGLLTYTNYNPTFKVNMATGLSSVVPGGAGNFAGGSFSLAAGYRAKAVQDGTFVWSDYSQDADFASTSTNQFLIRAGGGVGINTNNPGANALLVAGSAQVAGSARITGTMQVNGLFQSGSETGTSEPPSPDGLVVRRVNSILPANGQVVARTDSLTLQRDGTHGGFYIFLPAGSQNVTIACMGINSSGTQVNFYATVPNSTNFLTQQIYTDAQNIVHFECTFGRTYDSGAHLTQVTLSRYGTDYFWSGNVISTFNQ